MTRRALYYPLRDPLYNDGFGVWLRRVTTKLGFGPAEVVVLGYENDSAGERWALIEQPHVENSIIGIYAKTHGAPLPPPERKRVRAVCIEEIGGEA